jgi:hypothetical protein
MEKTTNRIFESTMFSEMIYVDENPAKVEKIYTWKKDGEVVTTKFWATYNLSKARSKNEEELRDELIHALVVRMNFASYRKDMKYFDRSIISRIFKKLDPNDLADILSPYDWCIAGRRVIAELEKTDGYVSLEGNTEVLAIGAVKGAVVYQLPDKYDEDTMFLGSTDSITPVFSKEKSNLGWMYEYFVSESHGDQSRHSEVRMKKVYLT